MWDGSTQGLKLDLVVGGTIRFGGQAHKGLVKTSRIFLMVHQPADVAAHWDLSYKLHGESDCG